MALVAIQAYLDGSQVFRSEQGCDAWQAACPNAPGAGLSVGTRNFKDGRHLLEHLGGDRPCRQWHDHPARDPDRQHHSDRPDRARDQRRRHGLDRHAGHQAVLDKPSPAVCTARGCDGGRMPVRRSRVGLHPTSFSGGNPTGASLTLPPRRAGGLRVFLRDAAGNESSGNSTPAVTVGLDTSPPSVAGFTPRDDANPATVQVATSDTLSGLGGGEIEIRRSGRDTWRSLPTPVGGQGVVATLPDSRLANRRSGQTSERVWDVAGDEHSTSTALAVRKPTVSLPVRVKTTMRVGRTKRVRASGAGRHRRMRTVYVRSPFVRHGRPVKIAGRLVAPGGNPIANAPVEVFARTDAPGTEAIPVATLTTGPRGGFTYLVAPGPSGVRFEYGVLPLIRPQTRRVHVRVGAATQIAVDQPRVVTGEAVRFTGRVVTEPCPRPASSSSCRGYGRGSWRTFRTTASTSGTDGRWRFTLPLHRHRRHPDGSLPRSPSPRRRLPVRCGRVPRRPRRRPRACGGHARGGAGGRAPRPADLCERHPRRSRSSSPSAVPATPPPSFRGNSVGKAQLRKSSVTSRALDNGGVRLADISRSARRSLAGAKGDQGPQGPPGLTFHASLNSAGAIVRGNATAGEVPGDGVYFHAVEPGRERLRWLRDTCERGRGRGCRSARR